MGTRRGLFDGDLKLEIGPISFFLFFLDKIKTINFLLQKFIIKITASYLYKIFITLPLVQVGSHSYGEKFEAVITTIIILKRWF